MALVVSRHNGKTAIALLKTFFFRKSSLNFRGDFIIVIFKKASLEQALRSVPQEIWSMSNVDYL